MEKYNTPNKEPSLRLINTAAAIVLVTLIIYILYIGKNLLLPLVIALVIWYIIIQFAALFNKLRIGQRHLPYGICLLLSIIAASTILYVFVLLLTSSISNIINEAPKYQAKLQLLSDHINHWSDNRINAMQLLNKINLSELFSTLAVVISSMLSNFTLIVIYLLFLLLETKTFNNKLKGICANETQYHKASNLISHIHTDINSFLKAKTFLNALAGLASYICLLFFHIHYAQFWGVLIFLLHFIPFIGPIVAVLFVMIAVTVQINSLFLFLLLAVILIIIQFIVGNLLEPKLLGSRLNLSPIVILIALAFWGYIWGIIGMFLCVPMMVIINIILANFPQTRPLAVMLSANWNDPQQ